MGRDLADEFRRELSDFYKDRLDLEKRISTLEAFMNRHDSKHGTRKSESESMNSAHSTAVRVAKVDNRGKIIIALILAIQTIGIAALALFK
jgi:hypothetical protein